MPLKTKQTKWHDLPRQNRGQKSYECQPCISLFKFRTANHKVQIETGRWDDTLLKHRKCNLCFRDGVGSERHYLFSCDHFNNPRRKYLSETHISDTEYNYQSPSRVVVRYSHHTPLQWAK